ncbi:MAG: hypothetical protein MdMp014T_1324 [Treponematales bacterium]
MKGNTLVLATHDDLTGFVETCLKDIRKFEGCAIEFDQQFYRITIRLIGEKYNSTITTPVMEYLLAIQKAIYELYKQYTGRRLSKADKKRLEIVVHVEKGSSDIVFSIMEQLGAVEEAVKNMTGDQTFAAIVIGIFLWAGVSIGKKALDHFGKKHEREIDVQKEKARNEKDRQFMDAFSKTLEIVTQMRQSEITHLANIDDVTSLTYSGETLSTDELKERAKADRKRITPEVSTITGTYRITRLHFNFESNSAKADMCDTKNEEVLSSVIIQPRSILDGTYAVLKKAQKKQEIELQLIVSKKGDKIVGATLDKVI